MIEDFKNWLCMKYLFMLQICIFHLYPMEDTLMQIWKSPYIFKFIAAHKGGRNCWVRM